jgi:hypothetical protein
MEKKSTNQMWHLVRVFSGFKSHLSIFIVVNGLLWVIWLFVGGIAVHPWPLYPSGIWGVVLLIHYFAASGTFRKVIK